LTKKLIEFFHKLNRNNAQFIFTALDSILLDKEIFRRDQIWFVDKNKFGSSELYSMSEFNATVVRNSSDFRKKYLEMNFGAADTIDISEKLIGLMYGK
jgi:AAA15 family ATPase/GTPase